ncbi:MAG: STAS-like domain-containing protein [Thermodesulfovibrionales bacterium]|nr:STAS-like domain-containing protein [Thermodesulfovibrionales bacterium]
MVIYDLYRILKEELKNGSSDLVTRNSGQTIRERIERDIVKEKDGEVIALDFSRIGIIDYSCADEIVAKLISRLLNNEYGERFIILKGLDDTQKENIEVALERKELSSIAIMRNGKEVLIGNLNNYLKETLHIINERGKCTAKELSKKLRLELNTAATRLLNLYKKKLIKRTGEQTTQGKVLVYRKLYE